MCLGFDGKVGLHFKNSWTLQASGTINNMKMDSPELPLPEREQAEKLKHFNQNGVICLSSDP